MESNAQAEDPVLYSQDHEAVAPHVASFFSSFASNPNMSSNNHKPDQSIMAYGATNGQASEGQGIHSQQRQPYTHTQSQISQDNQNHMIGGFAQHLPVHEQYANGLLPSSQHPHPRTQHQFNAQAYSAQRHGYPPPPGMPSLSQQSQQPQQGPAIGITNMGYTANYGYGQTHPPSTQDMPPHPHTRQHNRTQTHIQPKTSSTQQRSSRYAFTEERAGADVSEKTHGSTSAQAPVDSNVDAFFSSYNVNARSDSVVNRSTYGNSQHNSGSGQLYGSQLGMGSSGPLQTNVGQLAFKNCENAGMTYDSGSGSTRYASHAPPTNANTQVINNSSKVYNESTPVPIPQHTSTTSSLYNNGALGSVGVGGSRLYGVRELNNQFNTVNIKSNTGVSGAGYTNEVNSNVNADVHGAGIGRYPPPTQLTHQGGIHHSDTGIREIMQSDRESTTSNTNRTSSHVHEIGGGSRSQRNINRGDRDRDRESKRKPYADESARQPPNQFQQQPVKPVPELPLHYKIGLEQQLKQISDRLAPLPEALELRETLIQDIGKLVKREWADSYVRLYGSSGNQFGVRGADVDMCLFHKLEEDETNADVIVRLAELLKDEGHKEVLPLPGTRVPIVKFKEKNSGMAVDICLNNFLAVNNTEFLRTYGEIDNRLIVLARFVKFWAKKRNINEPYLGTLSSYAYVLLCIYYLQACCSPPLLPNLQTMFWMKDSNGNDAIANAHESESDSDDDTHSNEDESKTGRHRVRGHVGTNGRPHKRIDGFDCYYMKDVPAVQQWMSEQRQRSSDRARNDLTIDIVIGFFHHFAYNFNYHEHVVSVRKGAAISKEEKEWTPKNSQRNVRYWMCIEDPFETTHNLGRVADRNTLYDIRGEFMRASRVLTSGGTLNDLCVVYEETNPKQSKEQRDPRDNKLRVDGKVSQRVVDRSPNRNASENPNRSPSQNPHESPSRGRHPSTHNSPRSSSLNSRTSHSNPRYNPPSNTPSNRYNGNERTGGGRSTPSSHHNSPRMYSSHKNNGQSTPNNAYNNTSPNIGSTYNANPKTPRNGRNAPQSRGGNQNQRVEDTRTLGLGGETGYEADYRPNVSTNRNDLSESTGPKADGPGDDDGERERRPQVQRPKRKPGQHSTHRQYPTESKAHQKHAE
eukprot:CFRG7066T1